MPKDQVAVWVRGDSVFVRFPHSHTVRLPDSELGPALRRILRARASAAAKSEAEPMPMGPLQADVNAWVGQGNKVQKVSAAAAHGAKMPEKPEPRIRLDLFLQTLAMETKR